MKPKPKTTVIIKRSQLIARAIADPGAFLMRGDGFQEPIAKWQTRAVEMVLAGGQPSLCYPFASTTCDDPRCHCRSEKRADALAATSDP